MPGLREQTLLFVGSHYERTPFLERNFDLESKHITFFFFADQVLQQSQNNNKKMLSEITDTKSQD